MGGSRLRPVQFGRIFQNGDQLLVLTWGCIEPQAWHFPLLLKLTRTTSGRDELAGSAAEREREREKERKKEKKRDLF